MANTVVQWIPACMGCGSQEKAKLEKWKYVWRHSRQGVGVIKISSLDVIGYLCHDCAYKAKRKFKTVLISLLAIGIVSIVLGALATTAVLPFDQATRNVIEMITFGTIILGFGGTLGWLYLRYNMTKFFHTIKQGKIRASLRFTFKNPKYAALFNAANPGLEVKGETADLSAQDLKILEESQGVQHLTDEEHKKLESMTFEPIAKETAPQDIHDLTVDEHKKLESMTFEPIAKQPEPQLTKNCPQCSAELTFKAKFCNKCGYKFPIA